MEVARQPKCVNDVEAFGVLDRCSPHKSRPIARMGLLGHWRGGARPASAWGRARGGVRQQWLRAVVHALYSEFFASLTATFWTMAKPLYDPIANVTTYIDDTIGVDTGFSGALATACFLLGRLLVPRPPGPQ